MGVYRQEIREVLRRFMAHELSYAECVSMLNAALDGVIRDLEAEDLPALRSLLTSTDEQLKLEVERRRYGMGRSAGVERAACLLM